MLRLNGQSEQWESGTSNCSLILRRLGTITGGDDYRYPGASYKQRWYHFCLCESGHWWGVIALRFHRIISICMPLITAARSCQSRVSPHGPSKVQTFTGNISFHAYSSPGIRLTDEEMAQGSWESLRTLPLVIVYMSCGEEIQPWLQSLPTRHLGVPSALCHAGEHG